MQKSDNHYDADMAMIRIQALEWVQGTIQDMILNNVTTDWPVYDDDEYVGCHLLLPCLEYCLSTSCS
jgi:hypothetical protein